MSPRAVLAVALRLAAIFFALYVTPMFLIFMPAAMIDNGISVPQLGILLSFGVIASFLLWWFSGALARMLLPAEHNSTGTQSINAQSVARVGVLLIALSYVASGLSSLPLLAFVTLSVPPDAPFFAKSGYSKELLLVMVVPELLMGIALFALSGRVARQVIRELPEQ